MNLVSMGVVVVREEAPAENPGRHGPNLVDLAAVGTHDAPHERVDTQRYAQPRHASDSIVRQEASPNRGRPACRTLSEVRQTLRPSQCCNQTLGARRKGRKDCLK